MKPPEECILCPRKITKENLRETPVTLSDGSRMMIVTCDSCQSHVAHSDKKAMFRNVLEQWLSQCSGDRSRIDSLIKNYGDVSIV